MVCGQNILIHLGQAGCQIGNACWELLCLEHGIYPDGTLAKEFGYERNDSETRPYFHESMAAKYSPRALYFDMDPQPINDIKNGPYGRLHSHFNLLSGLEDACNCYARGFYTMGIDHIEKVMDRVRVLTEATDHLDSFTIMRSNCGGTGGGFGSLVLTKLAEDYGKKKCLVTLEVNPSPLQSTSPVEAYNSVLTCNGSIDYANCSYLCENEKIYSMFDNFLRMPCADYKNVNQLMAQVFSGLTAAFRFGGTLNSDPNYILTNLCPYPRIHFPILAFGPFVPDDSQHRVEHTTDALVRHAFESRNQMLYCNPRKGKYITACLLFRGDVSVTSAQRSLRKMKNKSQANRFQFADWCPTGVKLGLNDSQPISVPGSGMALGQRSLVGVMNNTCIVNTWQRILKKFDMMYSKRAFVHWFMAEGVDELEIQDSRENLEALMMEFHEIGLPSLVGQRNETHQYTSHQHIDLHRLHY